MDSDRVRLTFDVHLEVVVIVARVIFRARFFFIIFADSTTGFFFLAEALTVVAGLDFVHYDESRDVLLMTLLHFIFLHSDRLLGLIIITITIFGS